jgi:hypothetical protein
MIIYEPCLFVSEVTSYRNNGHSCHSLANGSLFLNFIRNVCLNFGLKHNGTLCKNKGQLTVLRLYS